MRGVVAVLRVILAGLAAFIGVACLVGLGVQYFPPHPSLWLLVPAVVAPCVGVMWLVMKVFNPWDFSGRTWEQKIAHLDSQGLIDKASFRATRVFEVSPYNSEGPHYYLELEDGAVLYLNDTLLYDFCEIDEAHEPELNQPQTFPSTQFETLRHRKTGDLIALRPVGTVLRPEALGPCFDRQGGHSRPRDGALITDRTYAQLKLERGAV